MWKLTETDHAKKEKRGSASKGGAHGGGAEVTAFGQEVLKRYREMDHATDQVAQAYLGLFQNAIAPAKPAETEAASEESKRRTQLE